MMLMVSRDICIIDRNRATQHYLVGFRIHDLVFQIVELFLTQYLYHPRSVRNSYPLLRFLNIYIKMTHYSKFMVPDSQDSRYDV